MIGLYEISWFFTFNRADTNIKTPHIIKPLHYKLNILHKMQKNINNKIKKILKYPKTNKIPLKSFIHAD